MPTTFQQYGYVLDDRDIFIVLDKDVSHYGEWDCTDEEFRERFEELLREYVHAHFPEMNIIVHWAFTWKGEWHLPIDEDEIDSFIESAHQYVYDNWE